MILITAIIMLVIQRGNNKKERMNINYEIAEVRKGVTKEPDTSFQKSASA